ncbi:MAG: hypothetical protein QF440_06175 [Candidatus Thalassarchaeaceae archaeon]|jgi:hypothetical protein|nr:hypothetical protein [Candidatus Thalassarchaeaceae archaeon]
MDVADLLAVTPEALAVKILERRKALKDILPGIESKNKDDADRLQPEVEKIRLLRDSGLNKISELKAKRNEAQKEARDLLNNTRMLREKISETGGMKNLDPNWAKEKLEEGLADIETRIQEGALSLNDERRLISERKSLLEKNQNWLDERRKSNPEIAEYVDSRKKMQKLFRRADKLHEEMLDLVERNETEHSKFIESREELRIAMRQVDRSRTLMKQSDTAIMHWEKRLTEGFGLLPTGEPNLLDAAENVEKGGVSSVRRRSAEMPTAESSPNGGEEE